MTKRKAPVVPIDSEMLGIESHEQFKAVSGTNNSSLQNMYLNQLFATLGLCGDPGDEANLVSLRGAVAMLEGIAPTDPLEGSLGVQMVATHAAALECLRRAMLPEQTSFGRDLNLKHAQKLMALYIRQVEVLDKHRGKGQQKVVVEYVNVESGGQAVVGHVETGSANKRTKRVTRSKARAIAKSSDQPINNDKPAAKAEPAILDRDDLQ